MNKSTVIIITPTIFLFASIAIIVVGLLVGAMEVFWFSHLFSKKSLFLKIAYKLIFYITFLLLVIFITYPIAAAPESEVSLFDTVVLNRLLGFLNSIEFASTMVSITFSLFISLFYSEISENIGHDVLMNFFTGKYRKPIEEKRIFLFSDMKSSTTIAEQLGHIKYFGLLKEG